MPQPNVIVVGSFVQDLVFQCEEFPRPGETIAGRFATGPGGKGSNQAVAAARAGARVAFIGAVGQDAGGRSAGEFLESEGITRRVAEKVGHRTGVAGIVVDRRGQNQIVVALGANDALSVEDVDAHAEAVRGATVLVAQLEANLESTAHALRIAKSAGVLTILNPAPMRPAFDPNWLRDVSILIPNETEFVALVKKLPAARTPAGGDFTERTLARLSEADLHAICRRFGVETLIVTLGERGCFVSTSAAHLHIPAVAGVEVKDTTGAGDAFVGAFAAAIAEWGPQSIESAARFANVAAAIAVGRQGAAQAMPQRSEIDLLWMPRP